MSEFTWGDLPKSQIDNQLITEAIDLAIVNHETDPTAHLGEGESLEQHKTNEIIDHPASSIVADKFSQLDPAYQTLFESSLQWEVEGNATFGLARLRVVVFGDRVGDTWAFNDIVVFAMDDTDSSMLDNLFQTEMSYSQNFNTANYDFGMGIMDTYDSYDNAFGFRILNGVLYTLFVDAGSVSAELYGTLVSLKVYTFRVITSREFQEAYYFIDNILVRTIDLSGMGEAYTPSWGCIADKISGTTNAQFSAVHFRYLMWSTGKQ